MEISTFRQQGVKTHIDELSSKIGGCSYSFDRFKKKSTRNPWFFSGEIWRKGQCARKYQLPMMVENGHSHALRIRKAAASVDPLRSNGWKNHVPWTAMD